MTDQRQATVQPAPPKFCWLAHPSVHLASLIAIAVTFLAISWRRWPDLITDFGRELYTPWRLAQGGVLYRDVDSFYGPLSQYFNAILFKIFGPGLIVLALANIFIFFGIAGMIFVLFRVAWGAWPAWLATAVFIAIFGMSRFITYGGNFTYIAPYAHETTHGMLLLLLLLMVLWRWGEEPSRMLTGMAGALFGLTLLTKPEIAFSAGALSAGAVLQMQVERRQGFSGAPWLIWVATAIAPTAFFSFYFSQFFSFFEACSYASRAWWNVIGTSQHIAESIQLRYSGFDAPAEHLMQHVVASGLALGIFTGIGALGWLSDRASDRRLPVVGLIVAVPTIGFCSWAQSGDSWLQVGRCLPGLLLVYLIASGLGVFRRPPVVAAVSEHRIKRLRFLLAILAVTMLARMTLNARIYHYGYYQAAIAAIMVPAILVHELPERLRVGRIGNTVIVLCALSVIVPGVVLLARLSLKCYQAVTYPIGEGRDKFFILAPGAYQIGPVIDGLVRGLSKEPSGETLVVLPQGVMLNYLTRMPSPLPYFSYFSAVTEHGREKDVVRELARNPPTWIIGVTDNLADYGIRYYGERSGAGADIVAWVKANYIPTGTKRGRPLDYAQDGAVILRKK